jgi:hypothetical protein
LGEARREADCDTGGETRCPPRSDTFYPVIAQSVPLLRWRADLISTVAVLLVEKFRVTLPVPVTLPAGLASDEDWETRGTVDSCRFLLRPD